MKFILLGLSEPRERERERGRKSRSRAMAELRRELRRSRAILITVARECEMCAHVQGF